MNLEKRKKANARRTPDTISLMINILDNDIYNKQHEWIQRFRKHMEIKHGKKADSFTIYMEDTDQTHLKEAILKVNLK